MAEEVIKVAGVARYLDNLGDKEMEVGKGLDQESSLYKDHNVSWNDFKTQVSEYEQRGGRSLQLWRSSKKAAFQNAYAEFSGRAPKAKHHPVANHVGEFLPEKEEAGKIGYINTTSYPKHDIDWTKFKKYMRENERNGSRNLKLSKDPREDEEKGAEAALKAACRQTRDDPVGCKLSAHCPNTKSAIEDANCSGASAPEGGKFPASPQHEEASGMVQTPPGKNEEKDKNTPLWNGDLNVGSYGGWNSY